MIENSYADESQEMVILGSVNELNNESRLAKEIRLKQTAEDVNANSKTEDDEEEFAKLVEGVPGPLRSLVQDAPVTWRIPIQKAKEFCLETGKVLSELTANIGFVFLELLKKDKEKDTTKLQIPTESKGPFASDKPAKFQIPTESKGPFASDASAKSKSYNNSYNAFVPRSFNLPSDLTQVFAYLERFIQGYPGKKEHCSDLTETIKFFLGNDLQKLLNTELKNFKTLHDFATRSQKSYASEFVSNWLSAPLKEFPYSQSFGLVLYCFSIFDVLNTVALPRELSLSDAENLIVYGKLLLGVLYVCAQVFIIVKLYSEHQTKISLYGYLYYGLKLITTGCRSLFGKMRAYEKSKELAEDQRK